MLLFELLEVHNTGNPRPLCSGFERLSYALLVAHYFAPTAHHYRTGTSLNLEISCSNLRVIHRSRPTSHVPFSRKLHDRSHFLGPDQWMKFAQVSFLYSYYFIFSHWTAWPEESIANTDLMYLQMEPLGGE